MKSLMNLRTAKVLNKNEQKNINGGAKDCKWYYCPYGCDQFGVCIDPTVAL